MKVRGQFQAKFPLSDPVEPCPHERVLKWSHTGWNLELEGACTIVVGNFQADLSSVFAGQSP